MGNEVICQWILIVLSLFEIWLYYQMLFDILLEKQYMKKSEKVLIWGSVFVEGGMLGINRKILFFSNTAFWVIMVLMILTTWVLERKRFILILGIVFVYSSLIALLDFGFSFLGMAFLGDKFNKMIYFEGIYIEKSIVYICTRISMSLVVLGIHKSKIRREMIEFRNILLAVGIVCVILVRRYQRLLTRMVMGDIPVDWKNGIISVLFSVVIMGIVIMILFRYRTIKQENNFMLMKEGMEQQKYEAITAALEKNKELIHDTKNHYIIISEYERKGEYEKLHKYVEELKSEFVKINPQIYTGNRVVDLVLSQKKMLAEQKKINFELWTTSLSKLPFKDQEICSIFGNLLDNALEACERIDGKRKIHVRIETKKHMLLIEIINTMSETSAKIKSNKVFLTSKKDKNIHGYGLKSVQRIVDMYEGTVTYKMEDGKFIVRIIFFNINDK